MTPDPEFTWIIDWTLVTVMGNAMLPRDPNDNDDEDVGRADRRSW